MTHYDHQKSPPVVYPPVVMEHSPPPPQSYPPAPVVAQYDQGYNNYHGPYVAAPPPAGYPTANYNYGPQQTATVTNSKGDGFWKGCVAALCCCWVLDFCCC